MITKITIVVHHVSVKIVVKFCNDRVKDMLRLDFWLNA